jgi:diguanylate cyclase (GGDEF)-like protein
MSIKVLIVECDDRDRKEMFELLEETEFDVSSVNTLQSALEHIERRAIQILVLSMDTNPDDCRTVFQAARHEYFQRPLQIVLVTENPSRLCRAIEIGGDDFISKPITALEFQARLKAAEIRFTSQHALYREREFFRQAVKQEEELNSKIIDEHLNLKKAFRNIEEVNEELSSSNKKLQTIAKYDILSGLLNRMSLFSMMDVEIERAIRTGAPLSAVMIDLDRFKEINDTYGHQCGDEVIRQVGERLRGMLRKYDHAGRYGGEEFFVILPNTYRDQGYSIAERFRTNLEDVPMKIGSDEYKITASLGVAQFSHGEARESWIEKTDMALYRAKAEGRNRVVKS